MTEIKQVLKKKSNGKFGQRRDNDKFLITKKTVCDKIRIAKFTCVDFDGLAKLTRIFEPRKLYPSKA
jgi:hypothetical protein